MQAVAGDDQPSTYVPNRNMIFLSIAVAYAETRGMAEVYYGAQRNDLVSYWDTTPEFVDRMNATLQLNRKNTIQIKTPFVHNSKADILRLGFELGVDYGKTWSCFQGDQVACGVCPACVQRLQAFEELGIPDPLPYRSMKDLLRRVTANGRKRMTRSPSVTMQGLFDSWRLNCHRATQCLFPRRIGCDQNSLMRLSMRRRSFVSASR